MTVIAEVDALFVKRKSRGSGSARRTARSSPQLKIRFGNMSASAHRVFWRDDADDDGNAPASPASPFSPSLSNHSSSATAHSNNRQHTGTASAAASASAVNAHCERLAATVRDGVIGADSITNTPFGALFECGFTNH
jgi:hypothetical protein